MRLIIISLLALVSATASAHETWIMPFTFATKPGEEVRFDITSGMEFPSLEVPVRPARIAKARWRLGKDQGELTMFREQDKSLGFTRALQQPGIAAIWLELNPRDIEIPDEKVAEYLDEISATEDVRKSWLAQKGRVAWKEIYTKHAKTMVAVGDPAMDESWGVPVGMKLELVPFSSPFAAKSGRDFAVRILLDGKALPRMPVGLMVKGQKGRVFATSDADGKATFALRHAGEAMIFAVHLRPGGENKPWQSDFTTLTLPVSK